MSDDDAIKIPAGWRKDLSDHMTQAEIDKAIAVFLEELHKAFPIKKDASE